MLKLWVTTCWGGFSAEHGLFIRRVQGSSVIVPPRVWMHWLSKVWSMCSRVIFPSGVMFFLDELEAELCA